MGDAFLVCQSHYLMYCIRTDLDYWIHNKILECTLPLDFHLVKNYRSTPPGDCHISSTVKGEVKGGVIFRRPCIFFCSFLRLWWMRADISQFHPTLLREFSYLYLVSMWTSFYAMLSVTFLIIIQTEDSALLSSWCLFYVFSFFLCKSLYFTFHVLFS